MGNRWIWHDGRLRCFSKKNGARDTLPLNATAMEISHARANVPHHQPENLRKGAEVLDRFRLDMRTIRAQSVGRTTAATP